MPTVVSKTVRIKSVRILGICIKQTLLGFYPLFSLPLDNLAIFPDINSSSKILKSLWVGGQKIKNSFNCCTGNILQNRYIHDCKTVIKYFFRSNSDSPIQVVMTGMLKHRPAVLPT